MTWQYVHIIMDGTAFFLDDHMLTFHPFSQGKQGNIKPHYPYIT